MSTTEQQSLVAEGRGWSDTITTLREPRISDRVYSLVKSAIANAEIRTGERIVESELARRLGVSQAPVRDALSRLEFEGIVTRIPRKGTFVTEVSEKDARQAKQVRAALEEVAGGQIIDRLESGELLAADLDSLKGHAEVMGDAAASGEIAILREADITFHRALIALAANKYLDRMWEFLEPSLNSLRAISDPLFTGDWGAVASEHAVIHATLVARDREQTAALLRSHTRKFEQRH